VVRDAGMPGRAGHNDTVTQQPDPTETVAPFEIAHEPTEITHLVCCRDSWGTTFCGTGTEGLRINLAAEIICSMCIEEGIRLSRGEFGVACPLDHLPCPDDPEVDDRIDRATS